jgi:hypothetical protein
MLSCQSLRENAQGDLYIAISIPGLSQAPFNQKAGDVITLSWKSFNGTTYDGATRTPIDIADDGELSEDHELTGEELSGFIWEVPYVPYGAVIYHYNGSLDAEGMIQANYSIKAGNKDAVSIDPDNVITEFFNASGACPVTVDGTCANCRLG